jgi:hypothetical protein
LLGFLGTVFWMRQEVAYLSERWEQSKRPAANPVRAYATTAPLSVSEPSPADRRVAEASVSMSCRPLPGLLALNLADVRCSHGCELLSPVAALVEASVM